MYQFNFKIENFNPELTEEEKEELVIKENPTVVEFVENHIMLKKGYASHGRIKYRDWQKYIQNLVLYYSEVYYVLPVQMGKSFLADMVCFYAISVLGLGGLLAYENKKKAESIFRLRLKPMILENKILKKCWSGKEKDLTLESLVLNSCFWKVAGVENRNDLATFHAPIVIVSEASKIDDKNIKHDVAEEVSGRQESYPEHMRLQVWETSPNTKGDVMYKRCFRPGSKFLRPHVPCPICGEYQELRDTQIKLRLNSDGSKPDHDPARIRIQKEKAVYYECVYCKGEIKEEDRLEMGKKVVWALIDLEEKVNEDYTFIQQGERILKDGTIIHNKDREEMLRPVCNADRLINNNPKQPFYERLAKYFEAKRNPKQWHIYLNNQRGWWYTPKKESIATEFLEKKMLRSSYTAFKENSFIPEDVLLLVCAIDTQDDGFWWLVEGFGPKMVSYVIRWGFCDCPINDYEKESGNYEKSYNIIMGEILKDPYIVVNNGEKIHMPIHGGFVDRGGHRSGLVDYITNNSTFLAYIGNPRSKSEDVIKENKNGIYFGKTETLSSIVSARLKSKDFNLPFVDEEHSNMKRHLLNQIPKQYHYTAIDANGNEVVKYHHGGNDHLRDCLNMIMGYMILKGYDQKLYNENFISQLKNIRSQKIVISGNNTKTENQNNERNFERKNNYFSRKRRF